MILYKKDINVDIEIINKTLLCKLYFLAEVLACVLFYATSGTNVENMFYVLFVLVGFGTIIHSMVDYTLALAVYKVLRKRR